VQNRVHRKRIELIVQFISLRSFSTDHTRRIRLLLYRDVAGTVKRCLLHETFWAENETRLETHVSETETRPRR